MLFAAIKMEWIVEFDRQWSLLMCPTTLDKTGQGQR